MSHIFIPLLFFFFTYFFTFIIDTKNPFCIINIETLCIISKERRIVSTIYCNKWSWRGFDSFVKKTRWYRFTIGNNGNCSTDRLAYYHVLYASMVVCYWERRTILIGRAGASTWPTIDFALALTRHVFIIRFELM